MIPAGRYITLLFCFLQFLGHAQKLSGIVLDKESSQSLVGASVYINNTTIGAITDTKGNFSLKNIPGGQIDVVISFVGYKTEVVGLRIAKDTIITVRLDFNADLLTGVVVRPFEKNGWEHWGFLFKNLFIGTSTLGAKCDIMNPKDIRFYFSNADRTLIADNTRPIIIINKSLGYRIEYDMQHFSYDERNQILMIEGYPFFTEMQGTKKQMETWQKNRNISYRGSLLHFIRSLSSDSTEQQGFIVRIMKTMGSPERNRVNAIQQVNSNFSGFSEDSVRYFKIILHQTVFSVLDKNPINPAIFIHRNDDRSAGFLFEDKLYITYPSEKVPPEYIGLTHNKDGSDSCISGIIHLDKYEPLIIFPSGNYSDPTNLIISGYWSWREKTATLLPLDFVPDSVMFSKK